MHVAALQLRSPCARGQGCTGALIALLCRMRSAGERSLTPRGRLTPTSKGWGLTVPALTSGTTKHSLLPA